MQDLMTRTDDADAALIPETVDEAFTWSGQDDPVEPPKDKPHGHSVKTDHFPDLLQIRPEFPQAGPSLIQEFPYLRVADIMIHEFEDTAVHQPKLIGCFQDTEEPAGFLHSVPEEAVAGTGLCGEPVPGIHFQTIGCQQYDLFKKLRLLLI